AGEDRAVGRASHEQRLADALELLLEDASVLAAIHADLAAVSLVEPGVAGDVVLQAVEEPGLERRGAGGRARAAGRHAVGPALDQRAQGRRVPSLHRVLELRAA